MANFDDDHIPKNREVDEHYNSELYKALIKGKTERVLELCQQKRDGPLHVVSIHNDTVLHMASYSKQVELVEKLLDMLRPNQHEDLIYSQNVAGNTVLHLAAAFDELTPAARMMLGKVPRGLLPVVNVFGMSALFRAVQFGKEKMFDFLDRQVKNQINEGQSSKEDTNYYKAKDRDLNILHAAVSAEQFDLAIGIAYQNPDLVNERDDYGMTPLQILSTNSSAFQCRRQPFLKKYIHPLISNVTPDPDEDAPGWTVPWWENIKKKKRKYESALKLAEYLVEKDVTSWKETYPFEEMKTNGNSSSPNSNNDLRASVTKSEVEDIVKNILGNYLKPIQKKEYWKGNSPSEQIYETPLFTATKSGCIDIVDMILDEYPQAVEHVDNNGCTILHIAIKYRQMEVFDKVKKMKFPMSRLVPKLDNNSNSILHMVGEKEEKNVLEGQTLTPALELQQNLILFEKVKRVCSKYFNPYVNSEGQTAEELFAQKNEELRGKAKDWLKDTAQNCSIVAVLIATVAFAAAYTVPGGSDQETGVPILLNQTFFVIFTISDVLSLTFTLTSVVIFLSILTSSFQLKDFKQSLPQQLMFGVSCLIFSVSMMMLAFAATIILMIRNRQQWTKIALYTVAFLPVTVFAISYMPLYFSLIQTFMYLLKKIRAAFPRYNSKSSVPKTPSSHSFRIMRCQCIQEMLGKIRGVIPRKPQETRLTAV